MELTGVICYNKEVNIKQPTGGAVPMSIAKKCSVSGCEKEHCALGYCKKHYTRLYKYDRLNLIRIPKGSTRNHPLYSMYYGMLSRCNNPKYTDYKDYGGRGIYVCRRWSGRNGFKYFVQDMGRRPDGHSLDRINNDDGYSPSNCRWTTQTVQRLNVRKSSANTSGTTGVYWHKDRRKWVARISLSGKTINLGIYPDKQVAIRKRLEAEKKYFNPLVNVS
jgi:hypothetical protein